MSSDLYKVIRQFARMRKSGLDLWEVKFRIYCSEFTPPQVNNDYMVINCVIVFILCLRSGSAMKQRLLGRTMAVRSSRNYQWGTVLMEEFKMVQRPWIQSTFSCYYEWWRKIQHITHSLQVKDQSIPNCIQGVYSQIYLTEWGKWSSHLLRINEHS